MALPIAAAPIAKMFLDAIGLSIAGLAAKDIVDVANKYIEDNPEESVMILKTLVPNLGIGEIFMKKGKDEEVEEEVSIEDMDPRDLTREEKAKEMKRRFKEGTGSKREIGRKGYEEVIQPGEDRTLEEADERYEGGIDDAPKPKFDYTKFFRRRRADGGAIGVESLFEERIPFRFGGGYQGGKSSSVDRGPSARDRAMGSGGKQKGGTFSGGGGGGRPSPQTTIKKPVFKSDIAPQFQGLVSPAAGVKFDFLQKQKFYNQPFKLEGVTPKELIGAEIEGGIGDLKNLMGGEMTVGSVLENMAGGGYGNVMPSTQNKLQEQILGQVDFGDAFPKNYSLGNITPTIEGGRIDIDETKLDDDAMAAKKFLDLKDGGRVGFNVGGITDPAALSIYNSMNAYGFSDQEIADAITAQGYDSGTLGQTTTPDTPTTPTPSEGIIGIDLQQRDTGGGFNPFGPLDSTFTKDLSEVEGFDYLTPTQQMNKYKTQTQDNMFGLGKFFQPKIRGTLGTRLANQPRLPLPGAIAAYSLSPFNPDSKNFNPDFVDQLNFLELGDDLIGMSGVGLKYGSGSVLAGKNVISGFGTNNYQKALEKFIRTTKNDKRKKQGEIELQNFLDAEKARKEREVKERQAITTRRARELNPDVYARAEQLGFIDKDTGGFKSTGTNEAFSNKTGRGRTGYGDGGLTSMFVEKR